MESDDDAPLVKQKPRNALIDDTKGKLKSPGNASASPAAAKPMGKMVLDKKRSSNGAIEQAVNGKRKSRVSYKESTSDDDDLPLKRRKSSTAQLKVESDSDDDIPLAAKPGTRNRKSSSSIKPKPKPNQEQSDSDVPVSKSAAQANRSKLDRRSSGTNGTKANSSAKRVKAEDSDDEVPLSNKKAKTSTKPQASQKNGTPNKASAHKAANPVKSKARAKQAKKEEEELDQEELEEEEEYKWWEDPTKGDGTKKWTTLEHNGVVFPPPYQPLPKNVKLIYDGIPVSLPPECEEVATFYGSMLNSPNLEIPKFNSNFFEDFKSVLDKYGHGKGPNGEKIVIKKLEKCDFKPIHNHFIAERDAKKALPAAEKKRLKAEKEEAEGQYMYCMWDGRKQKVGNFRVEPPALFRGRGDHPKTGRIKQRVQPEQITINIGENEKVPAPPTGHKWKEIKHDHEGTWLATWQENINGNYKYVMLAANSDIKGQSDFKKFEKARELKKYVGKIRKDYNRELKSSQMSERQRATAVYLIDQFALRAGNEKGEDEADTVGCCSLKFEHVTLKPPQTVMFDFLGKDSIRFSEQFEVDPQVFKNLGLFKKAPKTDGDEIFDRLTTSALNKHLSNYMQGLTAKVFRTYNASKTMSDLLRDRKVGGTIPEKIKDYNEANREVAILCNHKRTVTAGHADQMGRLEDRIKGLRFQQWRVKQMLLNVEPKKKKQLGADYFKLPEDMDGEWVKEHHEKLVLEARDKVEKKFKKDNERLLADGQKEMKKKDLDERMETANELEKKFKKERKTGKVEPEGRSPDATKYETEIQKLDGRILTMKVQAEDKEGNKEVALGTSKINYIDPRLTVVFSKKFDVPIEKLFNKSLREKFEWAIQSVEEDWEF